MLRQNSASRNPLASNSTINPLDLFTAAPLPLWDFFAVVIPIVHQKNRRRTAGDGETLTSYSPGILSRQGESNAYCKNIQPNWRFRAPELLGEAQRDMQAAERYSENDTGFQRVAKP